ncbi:MAG: hypothetical protein QXW80_04205 [Candidatus Micrarchaeia archaeon]
MPFAIKKADSIKPEWKEELEHYKKKCKFTDEEAKFILKLAEKNGLSPQRIIETIGLNSPRGKLRTEAIDDLNISIPEIEKRLVENKMKLEKMKKDKKSEEIKGVKKLITKIKDMILEEEKLLEADIKIDEHRLKRYKNIKAILEELNKNPKKDEITKKINKNTNFKSAEELF